MKKIFVLGSVLVLVGLLAWGCGQQAQQEVTATTTTTAAGGTTTTIYGGGGTGVSLSNLFDVTGAQAIAKAAVEVIAGGVRAAQTGNNDLLKLDAAGKLSSILNSQLGYHPDVTVIETNPKDGSLYVGLADRIYLSGNTSGPGEGSQQGAAFFRIKTDGSIEAVDNDISGMGTWYADASYGNYYAELPVKQVQFDANGNIYYLGQSSSGATTTKVLKMKPFAGGDPVQIGSSNMYIRDFLIMPNGWILFHGSSSSLYGTEWLRVMPSADQINNLFYSGGSGWAPSSTVGLRSYYFDKNNNVLMVGGGLPFEDENYITVGIYSGVIRVKLDQTGKPSSSPEALYDDKNMINYMYMNYTIGKQLADGYWDYASGQYIKFFKTENNMTSILTPLQLATGVTDDSIRNYIRDKYKTIITDNLNSVTFEGLASGASSWNVADTLEAVISEKITGETWADWCTANDLTSGFGSARQILYMDDGSVYVIMNLDQWGASSRSKGDKIFRILNQYGTPDAVALPQPSGTNQAFIVIKRARTYGDYIVFLGETKSGSADRIFAIDTKNPSAGPVDLTQALSAQIFSFSINAVTGKVIYNVWTYQNKSYLAQSDIVATTVSSTSESTSYQIVDVVPFEGPPTTTTTTTTTVAGQTTTTVGTAATTTTIPSTTE